MYYFVYFMEGMHFQALIEFFAAFAEWFSAAVVNPLIIYWGARKIEDIVGGLIKMDDVQDQHVIGTRSAVILMGALTISHLLLGIHTYYLIPKKLEALPFISIMFSISVLIMVSSGNPLKILVGLNMAENALFPLLAKIPLSLIPFMLVLMVLVNIVGVFVVTEAYREYGTLSVSKWRGMD